MTIDLTPQEMTAYARLLLGILEGDNTLSIRADEVEEAWRIVPPILEAWQAWCRCRSTLLEATLSHKRHRMLLK